MTYAALLRRREPRRVLIGTLLSSVGRGMTLPFLFIYLTEVRDMTGPQGGLVIGWYSTVTLALSPVAGTLIDRYGARRVLLPALLIETIGSGSLALAHSATAASTALTVLALGSSAVLTGQSVILSQITGEGERQAAFGLQFTLLNLGIGLGGLISGAIVDTSQPVTFQTLYLLEALSYLGPLGILAAMPGVGRLVAPDHTARSAQTSTDASTRGGYAAVLGDRTFRRLVAFGLVLVTCGYAQLQVGFPAFSLSVVHTSPRVVAWALASNAVIIVAVQLPMVRLLHGRDRSAVLAVVGVLFAAAWLLLGIGGLVPGGGTLLAVGSVALCAMVFGLGETMLSPVLPVVTNTLAPDALRGRYNSLMTMALGVGGVVGPATAAPLLRVSGGALWVGLNVAGCLFAALLALSLRRGLKAAPDDRRPQELPAPGPTGRQEELPQSTGRE